MTALLLLLLATFATAAEAADDNDSVRIGWIAGIHHYAEEGDLERLKELVAERPELINSPRVYPQPHKPLRTDGFAPLHHAAEKGHDKIVAYLIEKGADANAADGSGWTPLHLAAQHGHLGIVKQLVKRGAKVTAKTKAIPGYFGVPPSSPSGAAVKVPAIPSRTALDLAREAKKEKVAEFLEPLTK